jgi:calcineurin-like phosphoesterase family protein
MIWVTADHHFGHANIIRYCDRPFADVGEMTDTMVRKWNATVDAGDTVWHLGDFAMNKGALSVAELLNGEKFILKGNHDRESWKSYQDVGFKRLLEISDRDEKNGLAYKVVDGRVIYLTHNPPSLIDMPVADRVAQEYGARTIIEGAIPWIWLHGHSHGASGIRHDNVIDVGVDCYAFAPVSLDALFMRAAAKWVSSPLG